jgi:hypothetical protein
MHLVPKDSRARRSPSFWHKVIPTNQVHLALVGTTANLLGATDIHIILAELTLPGIAPRMQALTGAKAASVDAAREAARMRAASALSVIFPNEGYLSLGKITQGIHPNCYLFALLYSRVNPVQTNNLRMHRGEKYGSTCCFAERSRQVF